MRSIGSLQVSVVGLGCANFGRGIDRDATATIVGGAVEAGINFFDTADTYGMPRTTSEVFVGEALKPFRDSVIIATKFGRKLDDRRFGAKPDYVRSATEASLKRLQTDRIDLMQLHIPDPLTPIEDTLGALADLVREGKIREIGGSNFTAAQLRSVNVAARAAGTPTFASTQASFSLLHRKPVADLLAECEACGTSLLPYQPLFHGLLTGKYRTGAPVPQDSRMSGKSLSTQNEFMSASNLAAVAALTSYAQERGHSIIELAFGWLLAHRAVPSIIAGVSTLGQVKSNATACGWEITADEMDAVRLILDANAPSGDLLEINGL
ncbi:aldo/keto reductase [Novosphingobium flavum]|nr:aldo/keto reductase [Novosphingobium flavum]